MVSCTIDITVNDERAEKIGKGVNGIIPVYTAEEKVTEIRTRTVTVPHEETVTKIRTIKIPHEETITKTRIVKIPHEETVTKTRTCTIAQSTNKTVEYQEKVISSKNPPVIHTGPRANENLRLHINDMRTKAMGINDAAADPLEKAREFLKKSDYAVEYALNENTRMVAYQVRPAETVETLAERLENTIHTESVIADADMAREMVSYTKSNLLAKAAQAMLAQADKNAGNVLGLLR